MECEAVRIARAEVDNDVAAPVLPETRVTLEPRPPLGWERGLRPFGEDLPEVAFTLADDIVTFRSSPQIRDQAIELLEERIADANIAFARSGATGFSSR